MCGGAGGCCKGWIYSELMWVVWGRGTELKMQYRGCAAFRQWSDCREAAQWAFLSGRFGQRASANRNVVERGAHKKILAAASTTKRSVEESTANARKKGSSISWPLPLFLDEPKSEEQSLPCCSFPTGLGDTAHKVAEVGSIT